MRMRNISRHERNWRLVCYDNKVQGSVHEPLKEGCQQDILFTTWSLVLLDSMAEEVECVYFGAVLKSFMMGARDTQHLTIMF